MKRLILLTCLLAFVSVAEAWAKRPGRSFRRSFVQVSARDPRYFCLSDGQPYIPVGCNIAAMGSVADMEHYLGKMHRNGANFGRVWLNTNLFEIETRYGEVDTAKLVRIDRLLELADRHQDQVLHREFPPYPAGREQVGHQSLVPYLERRPVCRCRRLYHFAAW